MLVRLPRGTPISQITIASATSIEIEPRVSVDGHLATAGGSISVERSALVGSLTAVGDVTIAEHAHIAGDVRASGTVEASRRARIAGTVSAQASNETTEVQWRVPTATSEGDVLVDCRQSKNLYAGTYGTIAVPREGKLYLHTGIYVVDRLKLDEGAEVVIDGTDGPVQLYVRDRLRFDASVHSSDAAAANLFVGYLGHHSVRLGASFSGTYVSPEADLELTSCESCRQNREDERGHKNQHRGFSVSGFLDQLRRGHSGDSHGHDGRSDDDDDDDRRRKHREEHRGQHDEREDCPAITGTFLARSVAIEEGTKIGGFGFDWRSVAGPSVDVDSSASLPRITMPKSPVDFWVSASEQGAAGGAGGVPGGGAGSGGAGTVSSSFDTSRSVEFTLHHEYEVAGGIIANGSIEFRYGSSSGALVSCTYVGRAPTATPLSAADLNLGRMLRFTGCSDGRPFSAVRNGTHFEMTVRPVAGYPVTIRPPVTESGGCSDEFPILTPAETTALRQGFDWRAQRRVADRNPDGSPSLYYAWIYIRNRDEALALRKLFIHVLKRPLLTEELQRFAGKCGTFTNPGDGEGTFVPALIPGATYNKLIDALTSNDVTGNRIVFDVVRLRSLPVNQRYASGAIRTDLLARSGFRYLDYEPRPLIGSGEMQLDAGVARALTDVLAWVAQAARNVAEVITNTIGAIARAISGTVGITLHLHAINNDPAFMSATEPDPIMTRAWGAWHGLPMGALGMQTTLLQRVEYLPFAVTSQGSTDRTGKVFINAARGAGVSGSGMWMEARTKAGIVTDFLIANEICDLRGFDPSKRTYVADFTLGISNRAGKSKCASTTSASRPSTRVTISGSGATTWWASSLAALES